MADELIHYDVTAGRTDLYALLLVGTKAVKVLDGSLIPLTGINTPLVAIAMLDTACPKQYRGTIPDGAILNDYIGQVFAKVSSTPDVTNDTFQREIPVLWPNYAGNGAHIAYVRVLSGGIPVTNARVRLSGLRSRLTDSAGLAAFSLDAGIYDISVSADNYTDAIAEDELTVDGLWDNGTNTRDVSVEALTEIIELMEGQTRAVTVTRDGQGTPRGDVPVTFRMTASGSNKDIFDNTPFTISSSSVSGILQTPLWIGASYNAKVPGSTAGVNFTVTSDNPFRMPPLVGAFQ